MTIAVAITLAVPGGPSRFILATDTRTTLRSEDPALGDRADDAIKSFALGEKIGAVWSGDGPVVLEAAEAARSIATMHEVNARQHGLSAAPLDFFNTVRLFAYFFDRLYQKRSWVRTTDAIVAGFWRDGTPALALLNAHREQDTRVAFYCHGTAGSLLATTGPDVACARIVESVSHCSLKGESEWTSRVLGAVFHNIDHGAETTIGGTLSVAYCQFDSPMFWPWVSYRGRRFLRGFDLTDAVPILPPTALRVDYDQSWHASAELGSVGTTTPRESPANLVSASPVSQLITDQSLFTLLPEPPHPAASSLSAADVCHVRLSRR